MKFISKGEYLFKKKEKADFAYVVLYGTVIYFDVKVTTFKPGQDPPSPLPEKKEGKKTIVTEKPKDLTDAKRTKTVQDELVVIEEEIKMPFESGIGSLIGEIAMMDPSKASRALSGMAKTDSIFLLLNHDAFEILVKVKLNSFLIVKSGETKEDQ